VPWAVHIAEEGADLGEIRHTAHPESVAQQVGAVVLGQALKNQTRFSLAPSSLERVMHVERSARCMEIEMKRHPGVRRDPDPRAAWIPACAGMTTTLRAQYVDTPEYLTRSREQRH
jgi:hypothetical protein